MAQMALTYAVDTAQAVALSYASSALSAAFAPSAPDGPRLRELAIQTSTEGQFIPILYGRMRLAGQVIWAARFKEHTRKEGRSGKGGGGSKTYHYSVSFAVGLCEGEIGGIGRIWANGQELDQSGLVMRLHQGTPNQAPDPLIQAIEGVAPAYRDLAYVVFEDLPLDDFGQRIPNLSFEVFSRPNPETNSLEDLIKGVCLIPGSGEFVYHTTPVLRDLGPGEAASENVHTSRGLNIVASLDDLEASLPHCRSVAIIVSWFGTDLRAGDCQLHPGVEARLKTTQGAEWGVAGRNRNNAYLVSQREGEPVYGGTPSDESVIALIQDLKARGFHVTLYPFILMDIPEANAMGQPAFPWRGRITAASANDVARFFGHDQDFHYRHFILHHARLAKAAGGVDSLLIGSEMVGLTTSQVGASYPAVSALQTLAGDVRAIVGAGTQISYAADWSEYSGHSPAPGDRVFHLDPLWADPNIDYVALDWYIPLADARGGTLPTVEELQSQVTSGEGYDWYYASPADRHARTRTPISDGAYDEAWIWRYKDLESWWTQPHHNRIHGTRASVPTPWQPQSKPIRLMEIGCPAIDKGANQPNVFVDPKSSESHAPYFSSGVRDDLIQRRYLTAMLRHYAQHNPTSTQYGAAMIDLAHSHVWCWDARPFPAFPSLTQIWSDGPNWQLGHWLNGRVGQSDVAAMVSDIARRAGLDGLNTEGVVGACTGFLIDGPYRARDVLAGLGQLYGFEILDRARGPEALMIGASPVPDAMSEVHDETPARPRQRMAQSDRVEEVQLTLIEDGGDYRTLAVYARGDEARVEGVQRLSQNLIGDAQIGRQWAQNALARFQAGGLGTRLSLPPSALGVEVGDTLTFEGQSWRVAASEGLTAKRYELEAVPGLTAMTRGATPTAPEPHPVQARPVMAVMDIALSQTETASREGPMIAAMAHPWVSQIDMWLGESPATARRVATLNAPSGMGRLKADLAAGPEGRWDEGQSLELDLKYAALESVTDLAALTGEAMLAIETASGWGYILYQRAELIDVDQWRLSRLLRYGPTQDSIAAGARCVVMDGAVQALTLPPQDVETPLHLWAVPQGQSLSDVTTQDLAFTYQRLDQIPLSPVHLTLKREGAGLRARWIRRARWGGDDWHSLDVPHTEGPERYRLRLQTRSKSVLYDQYFDQSNGFIDLSLIETAQLDQEGEVTLAVSQQSPTYGDGAWAYKRVPWPVGA